MNNIKINNYKIFLNIDTDKLKLNGDIDINLDVNKKINIFEINSKDIKIISLKINAQSYDWEEDKEKEIIKVNGSFDKKNYIINIKFNYLISDIIDGLYYTRKNNKLIICTQLEPTSARKFIPCFDTPNMKATFDVKIKCLSNISVLSNSSIKNIFTDTDTDTDTKTKIVEFNTTPIMSTYLLCIVLGDIVPTFSIPLKTLNGVKVNGYSIELDKKYMEWSVKRTVEAINFYSNWFEIDYPLDKLDIVSIPNFSAGAMENWGLVTFREEYILLYRKSDFLAKIKILEVIYHEIAHQWFGNLVTLNTWNDLWLNESNATYFAWMALKKIYLKYNISELYYLIECKNLIFIDGLTNTHPIILDLAESSNPKEFFDEITYTKGCTVINYIANLLGEKSFQKSIQDYLKKNMYKNPSSIDLYKNFNKFSIDKKINYVNLMDNLIKTKGFPVLYIKYNNNYYTIRVMTFNLNKNKIVKYPFNLYLKIKKRINKNFIIETIKLSNNKTIIDSKGINDIIFNPDNQLFCICYFNNIKPNIKYMTQCELIKYTQDEFILSLYGYKNFYNYLDLIHMIFDLINLQKYDLLLFSIILDLNKIIQIYNISNIDSLNVINFIKINLYDKIIKLLKYNLSKSPVFYEITVDQLFIFLSINMVNIKLNEIIKNIYDISTDYFTKSIFQVIMKYYQNEEFDNTLKNLNDYNINKVINIIESFNFLSDKNFKYIFDNYKKLIKSQDYGLFFTVISKINSKQKFIIDYWINNRDEISLLHEIQFRILKNISVNIFDIKLINKIIKYVNSIISNENKLILKKIINILETNIIIYNNLI